MRIFKGFENYQKINHPVVTIGTFDGVHKGHQKLLTEINEIAAAENGESLLLTFWPHPRFVVKNQAQSLKLLNTMEEKTKLLAHYGLDNLLILPFTPEFSELSPRAYVEKILVAQINTKVLVVGHDHRFGKNRSGDFDSLAQMSPEFGFSLSKISAQDINKVAVSSTKVRKNLVSGNIKRANAYLGHLYSLTAKVAHGQKIGRTIGFPTANLQIDEDYKLIPAKGVYAVKVYAQNKWYNGMLNHGHKPTVSAAEEEAQLEVHLFDFQEDLYQQEIKVFFLSRIRSEEKFDTLEDLKAQLEKDRLAAKEVAAENAKDGLKAIL